MTEREHPNCATCRHYYVTWEPKHPKGCRAYGFKSPGPPCMVVFQTSGQPCGLWEARPEQGKREQR
ncbi:MAG: uracil-DNA glycosylase [Planctomycetota bacterium]|nr:uracil-DNA glycosylase [Planctomycetota bacterium]